MQFIDILNEFSKEDGKAERAAFDKAMEERLSKERMCIGDIMFQIYQCQKRLAKLESAQSPEGA